MNQHFSENGEPSDTQPAKPSDERMTEAEARAVIELWQSRREPSPLSALPSVPDVAEGLNITPHEASGLLAEVRRQKQEYDLRRPIETLDESDLQIGRAIEAGRLAARTEHADASQEPTAQAREAEALLEVGRIGSGYLAGGFSAVFIAAAVVLGIIFLAAVVLALHLVR